ncbi:protein PBDC1-like [Artemia franciscana]|uniref:Polysaccharide biosynthesis domain-containing protein n=1 Tax=Artemia franciscana TaxID=6661 RepID=A0AA88HE39_ARTSF|nr:hypothetical protein QYM36_017927 [Artemia franciscana]
MEISSELGISELVAGASVLSRPAEEFGNDSTIEGVWAIKAFEHSQVYFNLVCAIPTKLLRLTPHDDKIFSDFRTQFKDLDVRQIKEDELKSAESKEKWRPFCESFKDLVEDFNFATLLRLDAHQDYSEANTCIVPRVQFLAIELARNREGVNEVLKEKFKPQKLGKNS